MADYFTLSLDTNEHLKRLAQAEDDLLAPYAAHEAQALRKYLGKDDGNVIRPAFSVDVDKIVHSTLYNRYNDKTQVFSFFHNDDITRRGLHVQLVSRIGRVIGRALSLNLNLIEAIALGHDIGHTPFGHKGEDYLSALYFSHTGRYFRHNLHSVRVLKTMSRCNLTLQTYDGILCHCGEKAFLEYHPASRPTFQAFEADFERCYTDLEHIKSLRPSTLEGCVVRLSDMIAYVGKDRQDASKSKLFQEEELVNDDPILGRSNAEIINKVVLNVIKNSIGRPYLKMDPEIFEHLEAIQKQNSAKIYQNEVICAPYRDIIQPMMVRIYEKLLEDLGKNNFDSPIYVHHLNHPILGSCYRKSKTIRRIVADPNDIVTDYIASMTDDYFVDLYRHLFPQDPLEIQYHSYFDC